MDQDCIFCKIIKKEIPSKVIFDSDSIVVIEDIAPKAPVHYLIIPKKHIRDIVALDTRDDALAGQLLLAAKKLFNDMPDISSFRLVINNGSEAGQEVFHLHVHFLSGVTRL